MSVGWFWQASQSQARAYGIRSTSLLCQSSSGWGGQVKQLCLEMKELKWCVREYSVVTLQLGQSTWIWLLATQWSCQMVGGVECKQWCSLVLWPRHFPKLLESSCGFPVFSIWSLFLVCWSEGVHSALSCLSGVTAMYVHISVCSQEEGSSTFCHCCHLEPVS